MSWADGTQFSPARMQRLSAGIPVTYTVFLDGSTYRAETQLSGGTDYSDAKAQVVIQAALDAIANYGGCVFIKQQTGGNTYELDDKLTIPSKAAGAAYHWLMSDGAELHFLDTVADDGIGIDYAGAALTNNIRISGFHIYMDKKDTSYYGINLKGVHDVRLDNLKIGYNGIKLEDAGRLYVDNVEVVDSANEGFYVDNCQYSTFNNIYLDNCGGYGGHAGHDSFHIENGGKNLALSNLIMFGGKGSEGGQAFGLYVEQFNNSTISNLISEGFKQSAINISRGWNISLDNITINDCDAQGIRLYAQYGDLYNVTLNNFNIYDPHGAGISIRAESTFNAERIVIGNGVIDTVVTDGSNYRGIALTDAAGGGICRYVDIHDITMDTVEVAFAEANSSDYNSFHNIRYTNAGGRPTYVGANSIFPTLIVPFMEGTTMLTAMPTGWEIDLAAEYAATAFNLPKDLQAILQIKVFATSIVAEADAMHAEFVINAATDNEAYNTHSVNLTDFNSYSTNFGVNDNIEWRITDGDSATIASFAAGDTVLFQVLHEAAGGADCATDAAFHNVQIKYI